MLSNFCRNGISIVQVTKITTFSPFLSCPLVFSSSSCCLYRVSAFPMVYYSLGKNFSSSILSDICRNKVSQPSKQHPIQTLQVAGLASISPSLLAFPIWSRPLCPYIGPTSSTSSFSSAPVNWVLCNSPYMERLLFVSSSIHTDLRFSASKYSLLPNPAIWIFLRSLSSGSETEIMSSEQHSVCGINDAQEDSLNRDCDMIYRAIIESLNSDQSMETALDSVGVNLTTELVVEILQRFRHEEKAAFQFFTWAGHHEGYTHEPQIYNQMIDILSSTKYKAKQFAIACDILDYMKRKSKSSVPVDVLVVILRQYAEKHLTHLQKLTKKKKIRVKTQPEINAFNLLLDSLCKCNLVREAEAMVKKVKNKIIPDENTYNILFFGWCRVRNPGQAMRVLEEMIEMSHTPDNFTYNTAINTFCQARMVSEAIELFEFMRTKGSTMSSPTAKTYCTMIVALAKNDRMDECSKLMADMRNSGCLPDVSTYKELIEGMCMAGKVKEAYKFLKEMGSKGYPPDIVTYNCFLNVLCDVQNADEAMKLFGRMVEVGCVPSVHTYNILITMFFEGLFG